MNPVRDLISGRRVVLIDDSIVRGTTSKKIVRMVRDAGAKEVHVRISCPPTISPCYYGVDTPDKADLIAANMSVEEIRKFIEADSLGYLSLEGMIEATGLKASESCVACWNGQYPTRITRQAETVWERDRESVAGMGTFGPSCGALPHSRATAGVATRRFRTSVVRGVSCGFTAGDSCLFCLVGSAHGQSHKTELNRVEVSVLGLPVNVLKRLCCQTAFMFCMSMSNESSSEVAGLRYVLIDRRSNWNASRKSDRRFWTSRLRNEGLTFVLD